MVRAVTDVPAGPCGSSPAHGLPGVRAVAALPERPGESWPSRAPAGALARSFAAARSLSAVLTRARASVVLALTALLLPTPATAQTPPLSDAVREFVTVDAPVVAITGVRLVDGTGAPARADQTVVLRDGRIAAVGPAATVAVPPGAQVVDGAGRTLLPGWVMVHEHLFYPAGDGAYTQQESSFPPLYLAGGATTIRTGGSRDPYGDLNLKAEIDAGLRVGPKIHATGPYLNGPGLPILFLNRLEDVAAARRLVAYWSEEGATSFKAYMQISRAQLGAAIEEAHARGRHVTGHLCSVTYREAADLGIDNLEHGFNASTDFVAGKEPDVCPSGQARGRALADLDPAGPEAAGLIRHLVERDVALTSTLTVFEISTPGRPRAPDGALDAMAPQAREQYLRTFGRIASTPDREREAAFRKAMELERRFHAAGGRLVVGTDPTGYGGVVAGYANLRAVELLVEAGLAFEDAVHAATLAGAELLGAAAEVGSVEPGKAADLILVAGDPVSRTADLHRVELVFKDGIGYDSPALFASVRGTVGIR